jgi:hypothetical protein
VETAGAAILLAEATIVVDGSGTYRAVQEYRVDNETEQSLEIELPMGARLWTVRVAGAPVKPTTVETAGGGINSRLFRIPLIKTEAGGSDYSVEIKYGGNLASFSAFRRVAFPLVKTKRIQVELSHVRLHLPDTHQFFRFAGTMTRVHKKDEEGDQAAGQLNYLNQKIEKLGQMLSGKRGEFSRIRAESNLKSYVQEVTDLISDNTSNYSNIKYQSELKKNDIVQAEVDRQLRSQEIEREAQAMPGNRDQLRLDFIEQKNSRSSNVVNSLDSNFFAQDATVQPVPKTNDGTFNSLWLESNRLGTQQQLKQSAEQIDRIDSRKKSQDSKPGGEGSNKVISKQQFRQSGKGGKSPQAESRRANELDDKTQRYKEKLDGLIQFGSVAEGRRSRQGDSGEDGEAGEPSSGSGQMDAGGFGGGATRRTPMPGRSFPGYTAGTVIAQVDSQQEFVGRGSGEVAILSRSGLASLDFELPVRGNTYFFTTARGDTQIMVQAISKKQLYCWEQLGVILSGLVGVGVLWWLIVRINAWLSRRVRAVLLIVSGIVSILTLMLPLLGLIALIWGIGTLLFGRFLASETAPAA